jgi:hypothetical protein
MKDGRPTRTRGRQAVFFGPQRRSKVIRTIAHVGTWTGRRGPMRIALKLDAQSTLYNEQITFTASIFRDRMKGTAGTVVEAFDKLEELYRERTLQPARETNKEKQK